MYDENTRYRYRGHQLGMAKVVKVSQLLQKFPLEIICGHEGTKREITVDDLNRPALEIAGYFDYYPKDRVQILGQTELAFLNFLTPDERWYRLAQICSDDTPCLIITRNLEVPSELIQLGNERQIPILRSPMGTTILFSRITDFLENKLAPTATIHGVLVDVYGVGMLITGSSGIGKSETALELVKRSHRLVADDAVEIRQTIDGRLHGTAPEILRHLLEIRGLGIINVMTLFGAGAVLNNKKISVVIRLENWQADKQYDRLGIDEETTRILDTDVPIITIPVRPGRNLAVIVEVAAMNFRLKKMGYNAAKQFTTKLTETIAENEDDFEED